MEGDVVAIFAHRTLAEKSWAYASDPAAGTTLEAPRRVRLQAYREWGNPGAGTMRVFLPTI